MSAITVVRRARANDNGGGGRTGAAPGSGGLTVVPPAPKTLAKYGLSLPEWYDLIGRARGVCEICQVATKRLVIDHEHVKGWKKMSAAQRRSYVRGLLCWRCNVSIVGRGVTAGKLRKALGYLEQYESQRYGASVAA